MGFPNAIERYGDPRPGVASHSFSKQESADLVSAATKIRRSYTITPTAHIAMIAAMLKQGPRRSETTKFTPLVSPLFINGRRHLNVKEPKANGLLRDSGFGGNSFSTFFMISEYANSALPSSTSNSFRHKIPRLRAKASERLLALDSVVDSVVFNVIGVVGVSL